MTNLKSNWSYLSNVFDNATQGSYKKLDLLATDHHDKLLRDNSNTEIVSIYQTIFKPAYDKFKDAYANVLTTTARYSGRTLNAEALWQQLRQNVGEWSFAVEATANGMFRKNTINYATIFPNGYAPFQTAAYEQRLRALKSLIDIMSDYPQLATIVTEINIFYQNILNTRTEQQGFEFALQQARDRLDVTRKELVTAMHRVFGFLIYMYAPETNAIDNYYDLTLLRNAAKSMSDGSDNDSSTFEILPLGRKTIAKGNYNTNTVFQITNTSNAEASIWISNNENSQEPSNALVLPIAETLTIDASSISDGSDDLKYVIATNISSEQKAKISISMF